MPHRWIIRATRASQPACRMGPPAASLELRPVSLARSLAPTPFAVPASPFNTCQPRRPRTSSHLTAATGVPGRQASVVLLQPGLAARPIHVIPSPPALSLMPSPRLLETFAGCIAVYVTPFHHHFRLPAYHLSSWRNSYASIMYRETQPGTAIQQMARR